MKLRKLAAALCAWMALILPTCAESAMTGEQILQVEQALYSLGYHDDVFDALLDERTRSALSAFQRANGLEVTGEVDGATVTRLSDGTAVTCHDYLTSLTADYDALPILQMGSMGDSVGAIQRRLRELGYFSGSSDNVFGDATQAAILRFQMVHGLSETGAADRATLFRLNEGEPITWEDFLAGAQCAEGDAGANVRRLQWTLREKGYFRGDCTGTFGEMTQQALAQFQTDAGLEETGAADQATCEALYGASRQEAARTLRMGDNDSNVADLQSRLGSLGYFDHSITGIFGATTQTAVRLYQMAADLPVTGEADAGTLESLAWDGAPRMHDVYEGFANRVHGQDASVKAVMGETAARLRGHSFEADDEDLYRGFAFVQYVCVSSGIPLATAEEVATLNMEPVDDPASLAAGEVLSLTQDGRMLLAISSGSGRAVFATADSSWVLERELSEMDYTELVRWKMAE